MLNTFFLKIGSTWMKALTVGASYLKYHLQRRVLTEKFYSPKLRFQHGQQPWAIVRSHPEIFWFLILIHWMKKQLPPIVGIKFYTCIGLKLPLSALWHFCNFWKYILRKFLIDRRKINHPGIMFLNYWDLL